MKAFVNGTHKRDTIGVLVANKSMLNKYMGRKLRRDNHQEWLGIQNAVRGEPETI